jgi:hypothetical protein
MYDYEDHEIELDLAKEDVEIDWPVFKSFPVLSESLIIVLPSLARLFKPNSKPTSTLLFPLEKIVIQH